MKKYLVVFVFMILLVPGCMNVPSKITGPKWTNKSTLPLVIREKNADGTTNTEFRLDGLPNGKSETGPDLTGDGSTAYAPGGEIVMQGGTIGCIETNSVSNTIPIPLPGTQSISQSVSFGNTQIYNLIGDYSGFKTSNVTTNGTDTVNVITIQIVNGSAGTGGLTIQVDDNGTDIRQSTMNQGDSTVNINLTNFEIIRGIRVSLNGSCDFSAAGSVTITLAKLQISTMIIKGSAISSFPYNTISVNKDYRFDMQDIVNSSIYVSNCKLTFSLANMPTNLTVDAYMTIEAYDSNNNLLTSKSYTGTTPLSFRNASQEVEIPLGSNCSYLMFRFQKMGLGAVDGNQNITIDGTQSVTFSVRPNLTLRSQVQQMDVEKVEQSVIQSIALNLSIMNNTRLGLGAKIYLSPNPDPINDPNAVVLDFSINPAQTPGVAVETRNTSLSLTAQQISTLTSGQRIYNQFEIVDLSQGSVQKTPYPYLEIHASATLEILVNNQ